MPKKLTRMTCSRAAGSASANMPRIGHARRTQQHIEPAESARRWFRRPVPALLEVGHVGRHGQRFDAERLGLLRRPRREPVRCASATATRTPNEARRKAVARPIPDEPPVMSATLPCKGCILHQAISG